MSALIKKPTPATRTVLELRTTAGTSVWTMKIVEAVDRGYGPEVRIFIEKLWEPDNVQRGSISFTDTEPLDALIAALTELRETYQ